MVMLAYNPRRERQVASKLQVPASCPKLHCRVGSRPADVIGDIVSKQIYF